MLVSDTAITAESRLKLMQGSFVSTKVLSLEKSKMAGDLLESMSRPDKLLELQNLAVLTRASKHCHQ